MAARRGEALPRAGGGGPRDSLRRARSRATARPCRGTSRSPSASSATTPRRCSSSTRSARRARRSNPPSSRARTSRNSGSTSRPIPASAPSWPGSSSCAACGRTPPTSRSTATGWARRSPSSRPAARPADDEIEVVVPLRGLQMPLVRLELATATIVRADTVEVPAEARASEGAGAAGWEPTFLAAARVSAGEAERARTRAKPGRRRPCRRGLPPADHRASPLQGRRRRAWGRTRGRAPGPTAGGGSRPAPAGPGAGGYRLAEDELGDLATLSRVLAYRSTPFGRPGQTAPACRARWRGRSRASRRAWSATSCSRR